MRQSDAIQPGRIPRALPKYDAGLEDEVDNRERYPGECGGLNFEIEHDRTFPLTYR